MLNPDELDMLWQAVPDNRKFAFLDSLCDEAADVLLAFQERQHTERLADIERRRALQLRLRQLEAPCQLIDTSASAERRRRNREAVQRHRERQRQIAER